MILSMVSRVEVIHGKQVRLDSTGKNRHGAAILTLYSQPPTTERTLPPQFKNEQAAWETVVVLDIHLTV